MADDTVSQPAADSEEQLSARETQYNKTLSSARVHAEIVFGKLKGRFRSLNRLPYKTIETSIRHSLVACRLHNWLVKSDDDVMEQWMEAQSEEEARLAARLRQLEERKEPEDRESLYVLYRRYQSLRIPRIDLQPPPIGAPYPLRLDDSYQRRYERYFRQQQQWDVEDECAKEVARHVRQQITEQWIH